MITLNGIPINITKFPDKTSQVWNINDDMKYDPVVRWKFESEDEFMHLAQLSDLIDSEGGLATLYIDYLPYGRQDKEVSNTTTFALHTFAKLLNCLNFKQIIITDPHSEIALDLIHSSKAEYPKHIVNDLLSSLNPDVVCYPDKGAVNKYRGIYGKPYVYGNKVRHLKTGEITDYVLQGDVKNKKVLIIDDICDGGMTFKLLTKMLLDNGAKEVNMFVSHGIFSKGIQTLKDSGINRIFTKEGEVLS